MSKLRLFKYACLFVIVTAVFGTIYVTVQQDYRQSANDPQIQLAEDAAALLDKGATPAWNASNQIDAGTSLAPFVVIYSASGTPIAGSGLINGALPAIPAGVLAFVSAHGEGSRHVAKQGICALPRSSLSLQQRLRHGCAITARSRKEGIDASDARGRRGLGFLCRSLCSSIACGSGRRHQSTRNPSNNPRTISSESSKPTDSLKKPLLIPRDFFVFAGRLL